MARKSKAELEREVRAEMEARQAEIAAGIQKGIQEQLPGIIAGLADLLAAKQKELGPAALPAPGEGPTSTMAVLESLAGAIVRQANPGYKNRVLEPAVARERAEAMKAMRDLIILNHAKREVPVYKVIRATFINEILVHPQYQDPATKRMIDQTIDWPGVPNQAMAPVSDSAREVFSLYCKAIGAKEGFYQTGFKATKTADGLQIEPNAVRHQDLGAPFVMGSKGEVRRGHPGVIPDAVTPGDAFSDPRRSNPAAQPQTQSVLGTTAPPAVVS